MAKLKPVTDNELSACIASTDDALMAMHDLTHRVNHGAVDRLELVERHAKAFALLARAAADMTVMMLARLAVQRQTDELNRLKAEADGQ